MEYTEQMKYLTWEKSLEIDYKWRSVKTEDRTLGTLTIRCASVRREGGDGARMRTQSVGTEEAVSEDSKRPWIRNEQCPLNLANRRSLGDGQHCRCYHREETRHQCANILALCFGYCKGGRIEAVLDFWVIPSQIRHYRTLEH